MRPIKYNPQTEPLSLPIEEILEGKEVTIPVVDKSEGLYIRDRLTGLFRWLQSDFRKKTYTEWPRPIPHLELEDCKGKKRWVVRVDWKHKRKTRVVRFERSLE